MHARLILAFALLLLGLAGPAWALGPGAPAILEREGQGPMSLEGHARFWVETGRHRTVSEVAAAGDALDWQPWRDQLQHNLDGRALWVQWRADLRDGARWYITVGASGIDRVQLFHREPGGSWRVEEAGDSKPVSRWPVPGRVPTFELQGGMPTDYWLRIEHDRVDFAAALRLVNQADLLELREREQFLLGGYFGLATMLLLVAMFQVIWWRDRNFAAYVVYLATFTIGQAAYLGVGAQHLWDPWLQFNALSTFLLPALSTSAALWFVKVVTEPARFSVVLDRLVSALALGIVVLLVTELVLPSRGIFMARLVLTALALPVVALLIWLVWSRADDTAIRVIALGFVPVLVMALFPVARGLNLIPNSLLTRYGLAMGAAMEFPILFYALAMRSVKRRATEQRASALARTDALTGLADRRTLLDKLDNALARARGQKQSCALLLVRLGNHDQIASTWGREMLERSLLVAASHLRQSARDIDLAARVGERDFALLIEGPCDANEATARAQQLVVSGLRPTNGLPPELTLRMVVVMALLPAAQADAESSLQWVLDALASVRPETRKQIRALNF